MTSGLPLSASLSSKSNSSSSHIPPIVSSSASLWDAGISLLKNGIKRGRPCPIKLLVRPLVYLMTVFIPSGQMTKFVTIDPGSLYLLELTDDLASKRSVARVRKGALDKLT